MSNVFRKNFNSLITKLRCLPVTVETPSPEAPDNLSNSDFYSTSSTANDYVTSSSLSSSSSSDDSISEFAAVLANSHRFFFSSPGSSNSIIELSDSVEESTVKVYKDSVDPYMDFRRSMEEMIEAREKERDWEYLRELLSSYLRLNPNDTHNYIITAFADLVLCLLLSDSPSPERRADDDRDRKGLSLSLEMFLEIRHPPHPHVPCGHTLRPP